MRTDGCSEPLRIGHQGAAAIEPGNTLASFEAAVALGVDMIEFDVIEVSDGVGTELVVAHDVDEARARTPMLFDHALEYFQKPDVQSVRLAVDVKGTGHERRVLATLREAGLVDRSMISGVHIGRIPHIRHIDPTIQAAWTVPRVRRDYTTDVLTAVPALAALSGYRRYLPRQALRTLRSGRVDAIMAHWRMVTPGLLRAVREGGGQLFVWTVDDARMIERLEAMGVDGIITNDPRLFSRR